MAKKGLPPGYGPEAPLAFFRRIPGTRHYYYSTAPNDKIVRTRPTGKPFTEYFVRKTYLPSRSERDRQKYEKSNRQFRRAQAGGKWYRTAQTGQRKLSTVGQGWIRRHAKENGIPINQQFRHNLFVFEELMGQFNEAQTETEKRVIADQLKSVMLSLGMIEKDATGATTVPSKTGRMNKRIVPYFS